MAVSFVGSATASETDGSDPVIDLTEIVGLAEDDVVYIGGVAINGSSAGVAGVSTAGYDQVATAAFLTVPGAVAVERKVMGATPDTSATCVGTGTSNNAATYVAMAFRGVDTTTPEDVASTTATGGTSGGHPNPPSIDPTTDDCGILAWGWAAVNTLAPTLSAPTGYGDLDQVGVVGGDGTGYTTGSAWKLLSGNAAEDPGIFDDGLSGSSFWSAATIALRPAAGGTDTGFVIAGAGANNDAVGSIAWSNPGNVTADDGSNASATLSGTQFTECLTASNFGFSIPSGATIDGFEIRVQATDGGNDVSFATVSLSKDVTGDVSEEGLSNLAFSDAFPDTPTNVDFGGATELGGTTWTPAEVNSSNFGCWVGATGFIGGSPGSGGTAEVDAIWVKVYYTEADANNNGAALHHYLQQMGAR